jgi:hypothetical protein
VGVPSPQALTSRAALQSCLLYLHAHNCSLWAQFASCLTVSSGKVPPPIACCEHMQDPAGGHERNEQIKLHKFPKVNMSRLTLMLLTPSLKEVGPDIGFGSAPQART